jgi:hypothetical protein
VSKEQSASVFAPASTEIIALEVKKANSIDYKAWKTMGGNINADTYKYVAYGKTQPEPSKRASRISELPKDIYLEKRKRMI